MKKIFLTPVLPLLLICIAGFSCEGGGGSGITDNFIPNFINNYKDVSNPDVFFAFVPSGNNIPEGTFTGSEENFNTGAKGNFTGSFKNSSVTLTYTDGVRSPKTYTGKFNATAINPYKLTLQNGSDVINLQSL